MLTFDEASHRYFRKGVPVPGVTSVLAPLTDLTMVDPELLRRASEFGKAVHLACEFDDRNQLDAESLDPALEPYLAAWNKFSRDYEVQWNAIEAKMYHSTLRYAGTLDRAGLVRSRPAVVDIKTSTTLYASVGPQLAAYARAHDPVTGASLMRLGVQLKGDGTYVAKEYTDPTDWNVFASLLTLRTWCARNNVTPKF
jgi:hypothetical protein